MTSCVFITGATAGFGKEIAKIFLEQGCAVIASGRRADRLEELKRSFPQAALHTIVLDVRERDALSSAMESLPASFQEIDILVNNAGLALGLDPAHVASLDDWQTMIDTNIMGVLHCTRAMLPGMVARNRGHIINIGSVAGTYPYPGGNVYGATKAFLKQFTLNLKAELVGTQVRVSNIEPGLAETEFSLVRFKGDSERAAKTYAQTKPLTARDIAETVLWVSSRPAHVNINSIEIMPTCQASGPFVVKRDEA